MVDYKYKDWFLKPHIDKQLKISTDDGLFTATNSDIKWENFEMAESLCSESELRFGSCEASMVKFQIRNAFIPLSGKWITVTETLDGKNDAPFQYGRYKVFSDKPTADREYRDIIAYDAMYDIINSNVSTWYNTILPSKDSTVTMSQFRENFIMHFGLEEVVPEDGLVNDNIAIEKTIEPEQISGKDVITAICEINGCFGHIGRDGKFHYVYLPQAIEGLYPANDLYPDHAPEWMSQAKTGHLYPQDPKSTQLGIGKYIKCKYEDYTTKRIAKLQIRQEENDIGIVYPNEDSIDSDNCYIIEDNFLVYGKSHEQLLEIAQNIFGKITDIVYRPFDCTAVGNPCLEVGDPVRILTKYKIVESYILERTLKGIQSLRDAYRSKGAEKYVEKLNGIQKSIIQFKGKANILERTIEVTKLEMYDIEKGLDTKITVTTEEIWTELNNTKDGLETTISATAAGIKADVAKTYETKNNAVSEYISIRSSITQNANSITAEVSRASSAEQSLSSRVSITESGLISKVSKGNVSSEISQEAGKIHLEADRLSWNSTYSSMDEDGTFSTSKANITGGKFEVYGNAINETRIAVRYTDTYATEISASGISGHLKYEYGVIRNWLNIHPTASWISSPLSIGEEDIHMTYALYVGGPQNTHISNVLEIDNPVVIGSDKRLKKDIKYISDKECLENILKFRQAEFKYKKHPEIVHRGIIAQDAQKEFESGWSPVRNSGDYLGVAYEEIIADLIGAVKYLAKEISV